MKSAKELLKLSRSQWISVAVLASSLGLAVAVTIPNTFTTGTAISSAQMNANFAALGTAVTAVETALPLMWADTDSAGGGTTLTASGLFTANSVNINVPAGGGFIVISGTAFVNNATAAVVDYVLNPKIDGNNVIATFAAYRSLPADGIGVPDLGSLSYTLTVPITAGAHVVSQVLGPFGGTATFFYNRQNLTVLFIPASQGTVTPVIAPFSAVPSVDESPIGDNGR
jgi:hypothetical protein